MYCNKNLDNLLRMVLILNADVQSRDLQRQLLRRSFAYYAAHVAQQSCDSLEMSPLKGLLNSCEAQRLQLVQQFFSRAGLLLLKKLHCAPIVFMSGTYRDTEARRQFFADLNPRPTFQNVGIGSLCSFLYAMGCTLALAPPLRLIISNAGFLFLGIVISHGLAFVDLH